MLFSFITVIFITGIVYTIMFDVKPIGENKANIQTLKNITGFRTQNLPMLSKSTNPIPKNVSNDFSNLI